jgi:hypothetical protein
MKRLILTGVVLLSLTTLGACGHTTGDRALSGAGIGAGVGAVGGLMLGDPVDGAIIGGAVGAGTGALTNRSEVNLGPPAWR